MPTGFSLLPAAVQVLLDPPLPHGDAFGNFLVPVPVGGPPGLDSFGAALEQAGNPVGQLLGGGVGSDLVGGVGPLVVGGDDAAHQGRGVLVGAASQDVQPGFFGVFVVASPAIRIHIGGSGVAAAGHRDMRGIA